MRILSLVRYQALDLRRNLMQIGMPVMMLGMAAFFAAVARRGTMGPESMAHLMSVAITIATVIPMAALTAMSIAEEKERRTLEALLLTPTKPWEMITARLLTSSLMALVSFVVALLFFWLPIAAPGVLALYFLLGVGWAMTAALFIGVVANEVKGANGLISILITVPFSLAAAPWEAIAPKVWEVLRFTPYRPALELVRKGMLGGDGWVEPSLVLTGWLLLFLLLAITQIRRKGFVR